MQSTLIKPSNRVKKSENSIRMIAEEIAGIKSVVLIVLSFLTAGITFAGTPVPFVFALFGIALQHKVVPFIILCITVLGMALAQVHTELSIYILSCVLYVPLFYLLKNKKNSLKAVILSGTYLTASIAVSVIRTFDVTGFPYHILYATLSGFIYMIYSRGMKGLIEIGKKARPEIEEYIAFCVAIILAISSLSSHHIANVNIGITVYLFLVLVCSFYGTAGISALFMIGLMFAGYLSGLTDVFVYAFLGVTVLACALIKQTTKAAVVAATFIAWLITALTFSKVAQNEFYIIEMLLGNILFISFPLQGGKYVFDLLGIGEKKGVEAVFRSRGALMGQKVLGMSGLLCKVAQTLPGEAYKNTEIKNDAYRLIDIATAKICENCSQCAFCWEDNFYATYQAIFAAVAAVNAGETLCESDLPGRFKKSCLHVVAFVDSINTSYEIFKMDKIYRRHIDNMKSIAGDQLLYLAEYIHNHYTAIEKTKTVGRAMEDKLFYLLDSIGACPADIYIGNLCHDKYYVEILFDKKTGWKANLDLILGIVSRVLDEKIEYETGYFGDQQDIKITCKPVRTWAVNTWVAKKNALDHPISGDSYTFFENTKGIYVAAVGDGMGTGKNAQSRSSAVISLLECLYDQDQDYESTVKIINSFMAMKTEQESFSTMDMCAMNLYSGEIEFIKAGGCNTFVFNGKDITVLGTNTAPIGILNQPKAFTTKVTAEQSLIVVLLTDGVLDIIEENDLRYLISACSDGKIATLADIILEYALTKCNHTTKDDMLVMVNHMWKR